MQKARISSLENCDHFFTGDVSLAFPVCYPLSIIVGHGETVQEAYPLYRISEHRLERKQRNRFGVMMVVQGITSHWPLSCSLPRTGRGDSLKPTSAGFSTLDDLLRPPADKKQQIRIHEQITTNSDSTKTQKTCVRVCVWVINSSYCFNSTGKQTKCSVSLSIRSDQSC